MGFLATNTISQKRIGQKSAATAAGQSALSLTGAAVRPAALAVPAQSAVTVVGGAIRPGALTVPGTSTATFTGEIKSPYQLGAFLAAESLPVRLRPRSG